MKVGNYLFLGFAGIIVYAVATADTSDIDYCDKGLAYTAATDFVSQRLLSPTSADFPWVFETGVAVFDMKECRFRVMGYFDADNAFGAKIRTRYIAEVEHVGEGRWAPIRVDLIDPF